MVAMPNAWNVARPTVPYRVHWVSLRRPDSPSLRNAAQLVVGEHHRARKALANLYPELR